MCKVMYALKHISMTDAIPPIPEMDEAIGFAFGLQPSSDGLQRPTSP